MRVVPFRDSAERAQHLDAVVEHLRSGGLILYPTETVYGLGCMVVERSILRLARLKGRPADTTFLLLVREREQMPQLEWTPTARRLAGAFWPGPLTLVLDAPGGMMPRGVQASDGGVAVRQSPHPGVADLLGALNAPITSTSANLTGAPPARTAEAALGLLGSLPAGSRVWLLNGGDAPGGTPSTIVDCRVDPVRVLREGPISTEAVREIANQSTG